jgi:hypothetical protein
MSIQNRLYEWSPQSRADRVEADDIASNALPKRVPDCGYEVGPEPRGVFIVGSVL